MSLRAKCQSGASSIVVCLLILPDIAKGGGKFGSDGAAVEVDGLEVGHDFGCF